MVYWLFLINSSVYPSSQPPPKQIVKQLAPDAALRPSQLKGEPSCKQSLFVASLHRN